ncbi:TPA: hypothetical protein ACRR23_000752 [Clostridioides difficile]|nr:hypothetical protein [Clostridioides difficile]HBH3575231.1 hypothetical protein [Clostridioides difficile]
MDTSKKLFNEHEFYGKNIYLLGTAEFGPVNTPIKINSISHMNSKFGKTGSLVKAYKIIKESKLDCKVYLCKVTGAHAEVFLDAKCINGEVIKNCIHIKSKYANEIYNGIEIIVNQDDLQVIYPKSLGDYVLKYPYKNYSTLYDLSEAINKDSQKLKGMIICSIYCDSYIETKESISEVNQSIYKLSGGYSGLDYNKNTMYNNLDSTYTILEGLDIDIIMPLGVYYDDTFTDDREKIDKYYDLTREYLTLKDGERYLTFYEQLLNFCIVQMKTGIITHGVIGLNPTNEIWIDEKEYIGGLEYFKKINEVSKFDKNYEQLISVVAGDIYTTYGTNVVNASIVYAPLIASLNIIENTTNKEIPESFSLFNTFDILTIEKMNELGYVSFRFSQLLRRVVVSNGITMSEHTEYKYLCNVRIIQLTMCYIKKLMYSYIGENIDALLSSGYLKENLTQLLDELIDKEIISEYIINELFKHKSGELFLDLSLKTIYMLEYVKTYSGLSIGR